MNIRRKDIDKLESLEDAKEMCGELLATYEYLNEFVAELESAFVKMDNAARSFSRTFDKIKNL